MTLAGLLSLLALLAVGHALVTSVRRRRRDLAILKTLGFDNRQIRATIAWQATTLATFGLIIGIPAGIVVGGFVWSQVANGLGITTTANIPSLALLLAIPTALVAANLIAFSPRVQPHGHDPRPPYGQSDGACSARSRQIPALPPPTKQAAQ